MATLMRDLLIYSIISADSESKVAFLRFLIDMRPRLEIYNPPHLFHPGRSKDSASSSILFLRFLE
jgi:hypothetical protein